MSLSPDAQEFPQPSDLLRLTFDWSLFTKEGIEAVVDFYMWEEPAQKENRALLRRILREFYKVKQEMVDEHYGGLRWRLSVEKKIFRAFPEELKAFQMERSVAYSKHGGYNPASSQAYELKMAAQYLEFYNEFYVQYLLRKANGLL